MRKHIDFLSEKEQEKQKLYLVHHMHHLKTASGKNAKHELHHCFLFSKKNMKGNKYRLEHLVVGKKLLHILDKNFSGTLYDHTNNAYKINILKIKDKQYSVF